MIVLLVWVLLMENNRRGLFFGKKMPISQRVMQFARKNHGYFFSLAIVYTFWYHPMENTPGHLVGFFYMFLLMLQGSLFFTRIHINKYWTFTQEILVLIHGTTVAVMLAGRSEGDLAQAVENLQRQGAKASGQPTDVSDLAQVRALAEAAGSAQIARGRAERPAASHQA